MIALRAFTGVIGGKEVSFAVGDTLTDAQVKELGLNSKPHLAGPKPKGKGADAEPSEA